MKNCPVCGQSEFESMYNLKDYKITQEQFSLQKCTNCSLVITLNPPDADQIGRYYESDDYLEHSNRKEDLFSKLFSLGRNFMFAYKKWIINKLGGNKTVLDIGAGSGQFLNFMSQQGYEVTGIEMSERARKYAKENFSLDLNSSEYLFDDGLKEKYGIISLWHVMEHLYDLEKVINRLDELLEDDGHLVVALPNYKALEVSVYKKYWNGWDVPRHLWHFSPESLTQLFKKHNFKLKKMNMMPLDPFFNTLLTNKYRQRNSMFNIIRMLFIGGLSFLNGLINVRRASSIIYILARGEK